MNAKRHFVHSVAAHLPWILAVFVLADLVGRAEAQSISGTPLHRKQGLKTGSDRPMRVSAMPSDGTAANHFGATLLCSDCHSVHSSESHGFAGGTVSTGAAPGGDWLPPGGPNTYLLKAASSTELCLSCHDGQSWAPDVVTADSYGVSERSAGFFAGLDLPNYRGHKISRDPGGKPGSSQLCDRCHFVGSFATASVQCIDCHNPHGNGYYRNLWWASAPGSEPPILASIRGGAAGKARYEAANVAYPAPSAGGWVEVTNMCVDCHHTFFAPWYTDNGGGLGNPSPYHRHPGTNTESGGSYPINRTGARTDPTNWVNGGSGFAVRRLPFTVVGATDFNTATVVAATNEVFCLSCHKAHGSENPFSLRWDYGSPGSATAQDGCRQCHNNIFNE